jgi:hypothetical protein
MLEEVLVAGVVFPSIVVTGNSAGVMVVLSVISPLGTIDCGGTALSLGAAGASVMAEEVGY